MSEKPSAKDQFGKTAEAYLTSTVHSSSSALKDLVELVGADGGKVVDIGTGAGHVAYAFAPLVDEVVAFDMTPQMLTIVERESEKRGLKNVSVVEGKAEKMPFEDGEFDGVTCRTAAHHFDNVVEFMGEVKRILKPGGWFLMVDTLTPENEDDMFEVDAIERRRDPSHRHSLRDSEWRALFATFGFEVKHGAIGRKEIGFTEWVERMQVEESDRVVLKEKIFGSEGGIREYFLPREGAFDLWEGVYLVVRES